MTKLTTTLLMAGPRNISPWGDRAWRISLTSQLVEGGSSAYWLSSPTPPPLTLAFPDHVEILAPEPQNVLDAILMVLALHLGDEKVEEWLLETHNVELDGENRNLAPYWEIADDQRKLLCRLLSPQIRLGITVLEENSLVGVDEIAWLRSNGFDVDVFGLVDTSVLNS